jgi:hypothetical protein
MTRHARAHIRNNSPTDVTVPAQSGLINLTASCSMPYLV